MGKWETGYEKVNWKYKRFRSHGKHYLEKIAGFEKEG
jgi:hypothetical protein